MESILNKEIRSWGTHLEHFEQYSHLLSSAWTPLRMREDGRPLNWVSIVGSCSRSLLCTLVSRSWQEKHRLLVPHSLMAHVLTRRANALIAFFEPTQGEPRAPLIFPCPKKTASIWFLPDPQISLTSASNFFLLSTRWRNSRVCRYLRPCSCMKAGAAFALARQYSS